MTEILITSSVLILVIILVRAMFRGKVKQKLIYAMWLLAAVRLLVPIQFGQFDFSILKAAEPVTQSVTHITQSPVAGPSREDVYFDTVHDLIRQEQPVFIPEVQEQVDAELEQGQQDSLEVYDKYLQSHPGALTPEVQTKVEENIQSAVTAPTVGQIATVIWIAGSIVMAVWFTLVNLRHRKILRQDRVRLDDAGSPIPVYISPGAASPCLTGLMRPVIYLTPASAATEESKRHVLAHELTHWRHMDELWSLIRCLCLCIYWFHPLVWVAAWMSRRDCELACDESALEKLGENERIPYGKTLLAVVAQSNSPVHLMQTATSMNETKKQLAERVNLIVKKPKVFLTAAILLILLCAIAAGCVFTGHSTDDPTGDTTPSTESTQATEPPTDPTEPPTDSTEPSTEPSVPAEDKYQIIRFHKGYTQMSAYAGLDLSDCIEGQLYFINHFTREVIFFQDGSFLSFKEREMDGKQGKYVYYQKENEPNRIYCMDYAGTFRDRLVYETSETITEYRLLNHGMELEKIAVLVNHDQIIVADAETAAYKTVYDKEYIQTIVEFSYNEEDDTCIVVFQDENYYNVIVNAETGKLSYGAQ